MKQKSVLEKLSESIKTMPFFKRKQVVLENGAIVEDSESITIEEMKENAKLGNAVSTFLDAVDKIPSVDMTDKFSAIDRLNAAIAGIQFEIPKSKANEKTIDTIDTIE